MMAATAIMSTVTAAVVVVMNTGFSAWKAQEADIDQAFTVGADDYMVKPFRGRELVSRVNALTAKDGRAPTSTAEEH